MRQAFIGVDVGTSSARAGVFDERGALLATNRHPITLWHEAGNVVEQSSAEIWSACAAAVRAAMAEAGLPPSAVGGWASTRPARWWCSIRGPTRSPSVRPARRAAT